MMMKQLYTFFAILLLTVSAPTLTNELEGTWILMSGEYVNYEGKLVQYSDLELKSTKIIFGNHFSFVTMSGDKFWSAGSGTFRLDGNNYIEKPILNSYKSPYGKEYVFDFKIVGDTWENSRWQNGTRVEFEIWQREN